VAHEYLDAVKDAGVDTLVLGCTHYPLLKGLVGEIMGSGVTLIDSAEETAAEVSRLLGTTGQGAHQNSAGHADFIVSDAAPAFTRLGAAFLGERVRNVETVPLGDHR
jgi:glutamate racemase